MLNERLEDHALSLGFTFIIPDYTLLVPGNAHDLLEDVKVLTNWLHTDLNKALQGTGLRDVRTEDIVVVGQSAGGYLAYLMVRDLFTVCRKYTYETSIQSTHINPPPKAVAIFYGMGGDFLSDMHVVPKKVGLNQWYFFGLLKRVNRKNSSTGPHSWLIQGPLRLWKIAGGRKGLSSAVQRKMRLEFNISRGCCRTPFSSIGYLVSRASALNWVPCRE